jgi:hypothetical protein
MEHMVTDIGIVFALLLCQQPNSRLWLWRRRGHSIATNTPMLETKITTKNILVALWETLVMLALGQASAFALAPPT